MLKNIHIVHNWMMKCANLHSFCFYRYVVCTLLVDMAISVSILLIYHTPASKLKGVYWFHHPSVDKTMSGLYLPQYLRDPFYFYTSYQLIPEDYDPTMITLTLDCVYIFTKRWYSRLLCSQINLVPVLMLNSTNCWMTNDGALLQYLGFHKALQ